MKTRNNDSTPNETLLNQNITRRSFVKRGAVASAATVFGVLHSGFAIGTPGPTQPAGEAVFLGVTYTLDAPTPGQWPPISRPREGVENSMGDLVALIPTLAASATPAIPATIPDGSMLVDLVPPVIETMDDFTYQTMPDGTLVWECDNATSVTIRYYQILSYADVPDPTAIPTPPPDASGQGSLPLPTNPGADPGPGLFP